MADQLRDGAQRPRLGARPTPQGGAVWSDLPLFPEPRAPEPIVRGGYQNASRPLSVRRRTPRVARRRFHEDRSSPRPQPDRAAADGGAAAAAGEAMLAAGLPPASPGRRLAAGVLDLLLLAVVDGVVVALTARLLGMPVDVSAAAALPWFPLSAFLALFDLTSVVTLTVLGGQTLGQMAAGVRVVSHDGRSVTVRRALVRTVLSVLSVLPAGLGFIGLLSRSRCACHDWLTGTRVVAAVHG